MPRVLNRRTDVTLPDAVLVDRSTKWGNPYHIGASKWMMGIPLGLGENGYLTRDEAVERYEWMLRSTEMGATLMQDIEELRGKDLICWCAPLPCHAYVLRELANRGI